MSQTLTGSRKRGRDNCEEECCAFMPLSKRINSIHLNGNNSHGFGSPIALLDQANCFNHTIGQTSSCIYDSQTHPSYLVPGASNATGYQTNFITLGNNEERFRESCSSINLPVPAQAWVTDQIPEQNFFPYNPELNASDNPYYYESNKLLFDLYIERMQRSGGPMQPLSNN